MTRPDAVLVRERDLGDHAAAGPRPLPDPDRLLSTGRPVLLPLSSAMRVRTDERVIAVTYDDGPHPQHTPRILAELAARGVRATFFVLTDRAERAPALVRRMLEAGHEVALHGIDHTRLTEVFWPRAVWRIWRGKRRLERVTGQPVTMYRPTYGAQGLTQFLTARVLGMDVVYWTAWATDWVDDGAPAVARRALTACHPGAILLLHDTTDDTQDAGPLPTFDRGEVTAQILDGLAADSYRMLPAGELLGTYPVVRAVTTQRPWAAVRRRLGRVLHRAAPLSA